MDALGAHGDGVAQWAGRRLYIPGALAGERVRVKTAQMRGDGIACALVEVLEPAGERVEPLCRHAARCGGCALQHLRQTSYAEWKRDRIRDVLAKRGFTDVFVRDPVLIGAGARRRATFTAAKRGGAVTLGFSAKASHDIVAVESCPVLTADLNALLDPLRALLGAVLADGARARIRVNGCDNGADVLIETDGPPSFSAREAVAAFVAQDQAARVAWAEHNVDPEPMAQTAAPVVEFSGVSVEPPIGAFLQASRAGEHAIRDAVLAGVQGAERIAELYCGLGSLTVPLARQAIVRAVDGVESAVRALERAAGRAGLGGRVLAEVRDLERNPMEAKELAKCDAVVFDPPRAGAGAQAARIAASGVARVVAVSCNPATFARDARVLADGGLRLLDVLPIDQFTFSSHVELVARFERS